MKHSIATVSLSGTLPEKLRVIAGVGFDGVEIFENDLLYFDGVEIFENDLLYFDGVEIFENDLLYFDGSPADIRKMCKDLGLEIMLFQLFRDFEGVRVGVWRNNWNEPSANLI
ncbi:sugar phosphate isomerase/epimerase [Kingella kingae]|uniref:sugar phosphate isomerase/epimerase n=1 Tax=Kingella kingae TaxID=504 RepID=UPI00254D04D2|nr:sugar phosphate isomerase/epimerase [Kingella kingae]MDK4569142.1 sugar phosphate isomerase/epimerase [Kingella kingae]MDK4617183.1 sugar phosphate isomerase/epimerase [Kingella kingae]MDK4621166.1 sugar phosphate isomerase/epimerase [Kingella kingae]